MASPMTPPAAPPAAPTGSMMPPKADEPTQMGGRRKTAWMTHVKATMRANKGLKLKQVLKLAKKTYKKMAKRGGGSDIVPHPISGAGRRRKTRRSRRGGVDA